MATQHTAELRAVFTGRRDGRDRRDDAYIQTRSVSQNLSSTNILILQGRCCSHTAQEEREPGDVTRGLIETVVT